MCLAHAQMPFSMNISTKINMAPLMAVLITCFHRSSLLNAQKDVRKAYDIYSSSFHHMQSLHIILIYSHLFNVDTK